MKNINDMTKIHTDKSQKVQKEPFYFLKWIFKVEIIILVTFLVIGIIFNLVPDKIKFIVKYQIEKSLNFNVKNSNYDYEEIKEAINSNRNIGSEEKAFIINNLKIEIEENKEYIDIKETIKRLKNLRVSYHKKYYYNVETEKYELHANNTMAVNIAGNYNALYNRIDIYEMIENNILPDNYEEKVFDFTSSNKEVYFHELNHLMTKNSLSTAMNTFATNLKIKNTNNEKNNLWKNILNSIYVVNKNIFSEAINELFAREYFAKYLKENTYSKNYEAYENDMFYVYALAEIVSEETLRKYKFNDNISILISGLLEIDDNIEEVYKLFTSINSVNLYENTKNENYKKIHDGYAYFYEKKYNRKMYDDMTMLLYFYGTPIQTEDERNKVIEFLGMEAYDEIINIIPKGYVSKEYKNLHKTVKVEYTKEGNIEVLEL